MRSQCVGDHINLHDNAIHPYWHNSVIQWFTWKPTDPQILTFPPKFCLDQMLRCYRHPNMRIFVRFEIINTNKKGKIANFWQKMAKKRHFIKKWLPWQPDSYLATLYLHWVNLKTYESMLQSCFYVYYFLKYSNLFNFKGLFRKSMVAMEMATKHILSEDGDNPNINFCKGCFSNYAMLFKLFCSIMVRGIPIRSQCIGGHIKLHYNSIHPYF